MSSASPPGPLPRQLPRLLPLVIASAILGMSVSGPLARLSDAHPLAIAVWRILIALVAGSALFLGERASSRQMAGIAVAIIGALLVAWGDSRGAGSGLFEANPRALLGDLLAVIGAVTVGVYYLVGRSLRQRLSLWPYVGLVYSAALLVLILFVLVSGANLWPQPPREWAIFLGIAIGPMLLGHTGFNWALRYVPAYVVSLAILAEPVGATLIAALTPGINEIPGAWTLTGGAVVLIGLALGTVSPRRAKG